MSASARGSRWVNTSAAPVKKLLKCSKCNVASYCGVECQRIAWKSHHKRECKLLLRQAKLDKVRKAKRILVPIMMIIAIWFAFFWG